MVKRKDYKKYLILNNSYRKLLWIGAIICLGLILCKLIFYGFQLCMILGFGEVILVIYIIFAK